MNPLYEAIESHTKDKTDHREDYRRWWDESCIGRLPEEVSEWRRPHVAALMAYGGNIGSIPDNQFAAFTEAVEAAQSEMRLRYGTSSTSEKLFSALRNSPYVKVEE